MNIAAAVIIGALVGAATYHTPDCSQTFICLDFGQGFAALAGAVVFGVPGIVIGGLTESKKRERWRPVIRIAPRAALPPTVSHGAALTFSIGF